MIKDYIRKNLLNFYVEKYSKSDRICKSISDINAEVNDIITNLFTFGSLPKVNRLDNISATQADDVYNRIGFIMRALSVCANDLKKDYSDQIKTYMTSSSKIINNFNLIYDRASDILDYNCKQIMNNKSNQDNYADCANIGKFTILPYFRQSASMYYNDATFSYYSPDDIVFTNVEDITALPLDKIMAFKINSSNDLTTLMVNMSIAKTLGNMIYLKITNPVNDLTIDLNDGGVLVGSYKFNTNEVLLNFNPIYFDNIQINIRCNNLNKDKPSSIQIEDIQIFSNMIFRKNGVFESTPFQINNLSNMNSMKMYHTKYGDSSLTNSTQYISLSTNKNELAFNKIDIDPIDISLFKFSNKFDITNTDEVSVHGKTFASLSYDDSDTKWNADIKNAKIIYGINNNYLADEGISKEERFSAWSLVGNYYYTYIINYEDDVYVNVGSRTCTINSKEVTGNILIPTGISKIGVHIKDMDIELKDADGNVGSILSENDIIADKLYPYNLLYMFSGLPEYTDGSVAPLKSVGPYSTSSNMSIMIGESFIPFTEIVTDDAGRAYSLQLTKSTAIEGTYTIEPYNGVIRVTPYTSAKSISIQYRKAKTNRKACGILFNRLLTFTPLEIALTQDNSELFTIDGDPNSRSILMPVTIPPAQTSQFIFNTKDELMYISTRVELQSLDRYLTPIISDIYLQMR